MGTTREIPHSAGESAEFRDDVLGKKEKLQAFSLIQEFN